MKKSQEHTTSKQAILNEHEVNDEVTEITNSVSPEITEPTEEEMKEINRNLQNNKSLEIIILLQEC